jgi:hypothetical protein
VEVVRNVAQGTGVDRRINIELAFPSGEHMWREDLKVWLKNKLKKEIARTFERVRGGFDGRFSWMYPPVCLIDNEALPKEKKLMEEEIQHLLRSQIQTTIDWKVCMTALKKRFRERKGGVVHLKASGDQGIDNFFSLLECLFLGTVDYCDSKPAIAVLNFGPISGYHTLDDVYFEIGSALELDIEGTDQAETKTLLPDALFSAIKKNKNFILIVYQNLDQLNNLGLQEQIIENLRLKCWLENQNVLSIISSREKAVCRDFESYTLPDKFEEEDIMEYFLNIGNDKKSASENTKILLDWQKGGNPACEIIKLSEVMRRRHSG